MPQTTDERAARWPGMDQEAIALLKSEGWVLGRDWVWRHPRDEKPSERAKDANLYLIEEWDFGGMCTSTTFDAETEECRSCGRRHP